MRLALNIRAETGLTYGLTLADQLATLFREMEFNGVRTFTPSPPLIGDYDDAGNWLELRVLVPYRYRFKRASFPRPPMRVASASPLTSQRGGAYILESFCAADVGSVRQMGQ